MAKVDCSELSKLITQLAMNISAEPNIKNLNDVLREIQKQFPDMRRQGIVDAIVESTTGQAKETDELSKKLLAIRQEARSDKLLHKKINELQTYLKTGKVPGVSKKKLQAPEAIEKLREIRSRLVKELSRTEAAQKKRAKQREPKTIENLKKRIAELEGYVKSGVIPSKIKKRGITPSSAVRLLRETRDQLKKAISQSEPARIQRIKDSIVDLEKRIESGDILPKARIAPVETKQLEMLNFKKKKLQNEIRYRISQMKPKGVWEHIAEPWNVFRALMTGGEFSLVLRQGGWTAVSRPSIVAKNIGKMFKAFASEKTTMDIFEQIENRPNTPLYAKGKLQISPVDGSAKLTKMEEVYMSHWIEKVPVIKNFQRAGITFLNLIRADSFDLLNRTLPVNDNGIANQKELEAIANYINVSTGRGSLGALERASVALNTIFFAPKYVASRFQLILGQPLFKGTMNTRKIIAGEYVRALMGIGLVMLLGKLAGGDSEEDPRSANFGKIRFGRTRLDVLFGLSQTATVLSRVATGKYKTSKGVLKSTRGDVPYGGSDTWDVLTRFMRTKLSPMTGTAVDMLVGENVVGEEVEFGKYSFRLITPLAYRDVYEVFQDQKIPESTAMSLLVMFGVGLQTYGEPLDTWSVAKLKAEIVKKTYKRDVESKGYVAGRPHKGQAKYVEILRKELAKRKSGTFKFGK